MTTAVVVGASYIGWHRAPDTPLSRSRGNAAAVDRREVDRIIGALEADVRLAPTVSAFTQLGQLYLQRARDAGDLQNYLQAQAASASALALAPPDLEARSLAAAVAFATHDFAGALDIAARVLAEDPSQTAALALGGDAHLELGDYAAAADAYRRVAAAEPGTAAADVRLARLAYLQGRPDEARRLAGVAETEARAAALGGTALAFYENFHGQVELDTGHYDDAARDYLAALAEVPGWPPSLAGLGRARAAQGRPGDAVKLLGQSAAALPQPDTVAALGDMDTVTGRAADAATQYATVEVIGTLAALNAQVYNRQLAVFYADHDTKVDEAVRLAGAELAVRKDVFGYDTYAWALYKSGRLAEARAAADAALAQHTADARLLYHSGMISAALGDAARARDELTRALAASPRFDPVQAPLARAALARLPARG